MLVPEQQPMTIYGDSHFYSPLCLLLMTTLHDTLLYIICFFLGRALIYCMCFTF